MQHRAYKITREGKFRTVVWHKKKHSHAHQKLGKCKHFSEIIREMVGIPAV